MAEGIEHLATEFVVAAIAHEDAFTVANVLVAVRVVIGVVGGVLAPGTFYGDGQVSARIGAAKEDVGNGCATLLTSIVCPKDGVGLLLPRLHLYSASTIDDGNHGASCLRYGGQHLLVFARQVEAAVVSLALYAGVHADASHNEVCIFQVLGQIVLRVASLLPHQVHHCIATKLVVFEGNGIDLSLCKVFRGSLAVIGRSSPVVEQRCAVNKETEAVVATGREGVVGRSRHTDKAAPTDRVVLRANAFNVGTFGAPDVVYLRFCLPQSGRAA